MMGDSDRLWRSQEKSDAGEIVQTLNEAEIVLLAMRISDAIIERLKLEMVTKEQAAKMREAIAEELRKQ